MNFFTEYVHKINSHNCNFMQRNSHGIFIFLFSIPPSSQRSSSPPIFPVFFPALFSPIFPSFPSSYLPPSSPVPLLSFLSSLNISFPLPPISFTTAPTLPTSTPSLSPFPTSSPLISFITSLHLFPLISIAFIPSTQSISSLPFICFPLSSISSSLPSICSPSLLLFPPYLNRFPRFLPSLSSLYFPPHLHLYPPTPPSLSSLPFISFPPPFHLYSPPLNIQTKQTTKSKWHIFRPPNLTLA